jgi:hypothetical protein
VRQVLLGLMEQMVLWVDPQDLVDWVGPVLGVIAEVREVAAEEEGLRLPLQMVLLEEMGGTEATLIIMEMVEPVCITTFLKSWIFIKHYCCLKAAQGRLVVHLVSKLEEMLDMEAGVAMLEIQAEGVPVCITKIEKPYLLNIIAV